MDRLGNGADLVNLEEETVACLLFDGGLDAQRVGDSQIVTDDLDATLSGKVGPRLPVILVEGVLNGDDGVLGDIAKVKVGELDTRDPLCGVRVGVFEVQVVLALLVELGRRDIKSNLDLALVSSLLDGLGEKFEGLFGSGDVGCKSTFVTNVDG